MPALDIAWPAPGRYILAVSGGADSMVLLEVLARAADLRDYELIVAHFDHGIRADSRLDRDFVEAAAARYGLPFEVDEGKLGRASEAAARAARHAWLEELSGRRGVGAILTAHHQDDLLETSLLNLARGSGRLGLAPMGESATIIRPLINLTRAELRDYAEQAHVTWREDPTNADISNPRNLLRHRLLPAAAAAWCESYLKLASNMARLNTFIAQNICAILNDYVCPEGYDFSRSFITSLSTAEREELLLAAARSLRPGLQLDRPLVTEIANFAATGRSGKYRPLRQDLIIQIVPGFVKLTTKAPH
ncbi:MAG: hypothetical protein NVSMB39_1010 [Candidatus Saccharimonadales bacterium]